MSPPSPLPTADLRRRPGIDWPKPGALLVLVALSLLGWWVIAMSLRHLWSAVS